MISSCCKAAVKRYWGNPCFYICNLCKRPCDKFGYLLKENRIFKSEEKEKGKKPSERILEIFHEKMQRERDDIEEDRNLSFSIIEYLDELHEAKKI